MKMNLPIKFPSDAEVIAGQAARFRALSPEDQIRTLGELFRLYQFLLENSGRREILSRLACEDEERGRIAIEEFVANHG